MNTLHTPRLALEPLAVEHAREVYEGLHDPALYRYIPTAPPASLEALEARYARLESRCSPDGREVWLNWVARAEAGVVGLLEATLRDHDALIAYTIFSPHQRQGYAREGCERMLDALVEEWGARLVTAYIHTGNAGSIRLVERLGLRRVAFIPAADVIRGASIDEYRYELVVPSVTPA